MQCKHVFISSWIVIPNIVQNKQKYFQTASRIFLLVLFFPSSWHALCSFFQAHSQLPGSLQLLYQAIMPPHLPLLFFSPSATLLFFAFSSPIYMKIYLKNVCQSVLSSCLLSSLSSIIKLLFVFGNIFIFPDIFPFIALISESDQKRKGYACNWHFISKGLHFSYLLAYTCQHNDECYI